MNKLFLKTLAIGPQITSRFIQLDITFNQTNITQYKIFNLIWSPLHAMPKHKTPSSPLFACWKLLAMRQALNADDG